MLQSQYYKSNAEPVDIDNSLQPQIVHENQHSDRNRKTINLYFTTLAIMDIEAILLKVYNQALFDMKELQSEEA
jgi:hypothetical protein